MPAHSEWTVHNLLLLALLFSGDCALTVLLFGDGYALDFGLGRYA